MNKNPWLIAGVVVSGAVTVASFLAAFPETKNLKSRASSRNSLASDYSGPSRASRAWNGVTDTFGNMATNTAAIAMSVSDSVSHTVSETCSSVASSAGSSYSSSDSGSSPSSSCDSSF